MSKNSYKVHDRLKVDVFNKFRAIISPLPLLDQQTLESWLMPSVVVEVRV